MPFSKFKAVIFDLDGVITKTALVHSAAWKKMFDEYLKERAKKHNVAFREFSHENDYLPYVDGKPRYKGVESFLKSREIEIPFGDPSDPPGMETVCGLGNRKNEAFNEVLDKDGVEVYPSTIKLIEDLKKNKIKVGVASSSKNCKAVLVTAGILDYFETRVDGVVSAELGLHGKPEPDIFTVAADNLGVPYDQAVIVEDAVSGVQAGAKGNFGLVLGIARENNENELQTNGADIVVKDIEEIGFEGIVKWFESGLEQDSWSITYRDYVPEKEKSRETLLTVGNGYFGTRGAMEESAASGFNYPGTYIAGVYNRLVSKVGDRNVENEDFVNCTNWLPVKFRIDDNDWIDINKVKIITVKRTLDLSNGVLWRYLVIRDEKGLETQIVTERFASMDNPHLAALSYTIKPLNYSGKITVQSELNGVLINDGVERYRDLNQHHLAPVEEGGENDSSFLVVTTTQSDIMISSAARLIVKKNTIEITPEIKISTKPAFVSSEFEVSALEGETIEIVKLVSLFTSQEKDSAKPLNDAWGLLKRSGDFSELQAKSAERWKAIWDRIDIKLEGDRLAQKLLRLHLYHLIISFSPHNATIDAGITARGLHGEAYRGHIFWDELFILPFYNMHFPEVAKSALMYRYRRLDAARQYAKQYGYKGAMFPWQSGSDGREETQIVHLNPVTGTWGDDYSSLQRHVSLAIAYNVWQYFHVTEDVEFIRDYGAEMFLEICRFWASKSKMNPETGRYEIKNVMGPDEFHESYPGAKEGGIKDNTYTNLMVVWAFDRAFEILNLSDQEAIKRLRAKIALSDDEIENWKAISDNMNIVISDNILAQYDGYFELKELDWDHYKKKYGNVYRMDRLLKAEGKSPDDYKVAKQADTLQVFYNLDEDKVTAILKHLGYHLSTDYLVKNLVYYLQRTSHGSTLSRVVHAQLANMIDDRKLSWELYLDALTSDYSDIQGGTTGEGIHAGVMAGTVLIALQSFAGLDLKKEIVRFEPKLPEHWRSVSFSFDFKKVRYQCKVTHDYVEVTQTNMKKATAEIEVKGRKYTIDPGKAVKINIDK